MAAVTVGILSVLFLFMIAFSLQVDGKKSFCDVFLVWMVMESKPKLFVFFQHVHKIQSKTQPGKTA